MRNTRRSWRVTREAKAEAQSSRKARWGDIMDDLSALRDALEYDDLQSVSESRGKQNRNTLDAGSDGDGNRDASRAVSSETLFPAKESASTTRERKIRARDQRFREGRDDYISDDNNQSDSESDHTDEGVEATFHKIAEKQALQEESETSAVTSLRKYQRKLLQDVEQGIAKNKHTLVYLPTGGGKTMLAGHLIRRFVRKRPVDSSHALFVVNRNALIDQTARTMEACGMAPHEYGFIKAGYKRTSNSPLQIASIQTLFSKAELRETDPTLDSIRLLVVDEAHCMLAEQYMQLTGRFKEAVVVGLTATPFRMRKEEALNDIFPRLAQGPSVSRMIRRGYLVPPVFLAPSSAPGRILTGKVAVMEETLDSAVARWMSCCRDTTTIVFCASVKQSKMLVEKFMDAGVSAAHLDGTTSEKVRRQTFTLTEEGKLLVLCSVGVLSEGFDLPCIETVILLRPTESRGLYVQQVGRGLRIFPGKKRCIILDEVGNIYKHGPVDGPMGFEWESLPGVAEGSDARARRKAEALTQRLVRPCKGSKCPALLHCKDPRLYCILCEEKKRSTRRNVKPADSKENVLSPGPSCASSLNVVSTKEENHVATTRSSMQKLSSSRTSKNQEADRKPSGNDSVESASEFLKSTLKPKHNSTEFETEATRASLFATSRHAANKTAQPQPPFAPSAKTLKPKSHRAGPKFSKDQSCSSASLTTDADELAEMFENGLTVSAAPDDIE